MTLDVPITLSCLFFFAFSNHFPASSVLGTLVDRLPLLFAFRHAAKDPPPSSRLPHISHSARLENDGCEGEPNSSILVIPP